MWITSYWFKPDSKLARNGLPQDRPSYYLLAKEDARIKYGVDHSTYQSTLAKDFGGAPSLSELLRVHGWWITFIYCFSASFTSHYRLLPSSPFYSEEMVEVERTEIWDTIRRRGVIGNIWMGFLPMLGYGFVNVSYLSCFVRAYADISYLSSSPHSCSKSSGSPSEDLTYSECIREHEEWKGRL
jgi:dimethylaniline monooxygenase (N-oxide forming)